MRTANFVSGIVLLVASALFWFWLIPTQIEAHVGDEVSPRLLPQICVLGVGFLSCLLIFNNLPWRAGAHAESGSAPISRSELRALLIISAAIAAAIVLFTAFGPVPASLFLTTTVLFAMGERRPLPFILIPGCLLSGAYLLFYKLLGTAIV